MKRFLSLMIAMALIISTVPAFAGASTTFKQTSEVYGYWLYTTITEDHFGNIGYYFDSKGTYTIERISGTSKIELCSAYKSNSEPAKLFLSKDKKSIAYSEGNVHEMGLFEGSFIKNAKGKIEFGYQNNKTKKFIAIFKYFKTKEALETYLSADKTTKTLIAKEKAELDKMMARIEKDNKAVTHLIHTFGNGKDFEIKNNGTPLTLTGNELVFGAEKMSFTLDMKTLAIEDPTVENWVGKIGVVGVGSNAGYDTFGKTYKIDITVEGVDSCSVLYTEVQ